MEVAKPPFDMNASTDVGTGSGGGTTQVYSTSEDSVSFSADNSDIAAGESVTFSISGEDGGITTFGGDGGEKMELEYTGESKSVIIPAGVDIVNLIGGEATLDAIKKGSVLMLTVDDSSGTPTASSAMIME